MINNTLVIMCGGSGSRFGSHEPKALTRPYWLNGTSVLGRLLAQADGLFEQVIVVAPRAVEHLYRDEVNSVAAVTKSFRLSMHLTDQPQGTGQALLSVLDTMTTHDDVTVIWGDTVLRSPATLGMLAMCDMRSGMMFPVFKHAADSVPYVEILRDPNGYAYKAVFGDGTVAGGYQDMCMFRVVRHLIIDALQRYWNQHKTEEFNLLHILPEVYSTRYPALTYDCQVGADEVKSFNTYDELHAVGEWLVKEVSQ